MSVVYLPLEQWKRAWETDNLRVRCRACLVTQAHAQSLAAQPFAHAIKCPARSFAPQYPLRELQRILRDQLSIE